MGNNRSNRSVTWQKVGLSVLCVVLALILIAMIFVTAYANYLLNRIGRVPSGNNATQDIVWDIPTEPEDTDFTGPSVHETDVTVNTVPYNPPADTNSDGIINIMLIGQDRRPGEPRQRSDSMILCSFNTNTNTITLISFLRDTYVQIPGYKPEKLNAAYAHGGFKSLNETLAVNFGVHVDANVEVDFDGFMDVIDLLGGVDISLTQKEVDHLKEWYGWDLKVGLNHLNGAQALGYSRIRKIDMDSVRAQRQRTVLMALIEKYKNKSITEALSLLEQILPLITTDMTNNQIISYVWDLFPMLSTATFASQQIPAPGTFEDKTVGNITAAKVADMTVNRKILENILSNP